MEVGLVALAAVACPIGMGLMMWFMAKGMSGSKDKETSGDSVEVERLRSEQERLAAEVGRLEAERSRDAGATAR